MTRVKICGITRVEDALDAAEAGVDFLGFVFADSPRKTTPRAARRIVDALPSSVETVAVFRDAPAEEVRIVAHESGIGTLQFHGLEDPVYCAEFDASVWKRFEVDDEDTAESVRRRVAGYDVSACLLDPGAGSGQAFRWELGRSVSLPLVIAGGLTPGNVSEAIRRVRPWAVDASSGLETAPGIKNRRKMMDFIAAVREEDAHHTT